MLHCPQKLTKATKSKSPASAIIFATSAHVLNFWGTGKKMSPVYFVLLRAGSEIRYQGGLATAFDLAAFRLSMIAPVKKSVNHSRTVASMRETGWEKQQEAHLRSDSTV